MSERPHSTPSTPSGKHLRPSHARIVGAAVNPMLRYLGKLRARMYEVGFRPSDPLMGVVEKAYDALHHLSVVLHYQGCEKER
ncbi:MAG: hypothetical protein K2X38_07930 [Gemmataceae bacterium]|nr:hypothetical protein [Gemmataceae bacterium]